MAPALSGEPSVIALNQSARYCPGKPWIIILDQWTISSFAKLVRHISWTQYFTGDTVIWVTYAVSSSSQPRDFGFIMALRTSLRSHAVGKAKYCYLNQSRQSVGGLSVSMVSIGREECLPAYRVSAVDVPHNALEFVAAGRGGARNAEGQRELTPGTIFSYEHRTAPEVTSDEAHPMTKYFVTYAIHETEQANPLAILCPGQGIAIRHTPDLGTFHALFEALINEARRPAAASTAIAYRFLELIALKAEHCRDEGEERDSAAARTYAAARSCIEADFLELDGLADLSTRLGLDATYLCKLFRRFGDETPHQSIIRHKLNHAAEMLLGGTLPVNRIADAVGFQDPFYFSRLFRKRFGLSPTHFRGGARHRSPPNDPSAP